MKKARLFGCTLFVMLFVLLNLSVTASLAGNVPQGVLDVRNSVVRVVCYATDDHVNGDMFIGSGFAIGQGEPVQYFVTNYHVIKPNEKDVYILRGEDDLVKATVACKVEQSDLCVLQVGTPIDGIPPVTISDSEANVGEAIYALGFPGAADALSDNFTGNPEDVTITNGIVSAVKSLTLVDNAPSIRLLQINAAISPGNSGGPLVDEQGYVLGIDTYTVTDSQNINGAIASTVLGEILHQQGYAYISDQAETPPASGSRNASALFLEALPVLLIAALVFLGLVAILVIVILRGGRSRKAVGVPLDVYLRQWGGKVPLDMALSILQPVFAELVRLHGAGMTHRSISPTTVLVDRANRAHLLPAAKAMMPPVIDGFSAPEQYMANGMIGPWTDLHALCAVLYFMVTGKRPLGALMRQNGQYDEPLTGFGVDGNRSIVLHDGMSPNPAQRPRGVAALAGLLGLQLQAAAPVPGAVKPIKPAVARKKRSLRFKLIVAASAFVVCAGAIMGPYLFFQFNYDAAVRFFDQMNYHKAAAALAYTPAWFRDAHKYQLYCVGKEALQDQRFSDARFYFSGLGDYRDAKELLTEVDYQEAMQLLSVHDLEKAAKIANDLKKENYSGAAELLNEIQYQKADELFNQKDYLGAMKVYQKLSDYKDSIEKMDSCKKAFYGIAVTLYYSGEYSKAQNSFKALDGYNDSERYITLCDAHLAQYDDSYDSQLKTYNSLVAISGFEDADTQLQNNVFIYFYLSGKWSDSQGYYFSLMYDKTDQYWHVDNNIPGEDGEYFKIEDMAYYVGSDSAGWKKAYTFTFGSGNVLKLYCYKNNTTYYFQR